MPTKEKILDIARKEFAQHGYDALSMNNLAKTLDVNKATIYYHFKDKQALYQEVIFSILINTRVKREKEFDSSLSPKENFRNFIKYTFAGIKECKEMIPLLLRESANFISNIDSTFDEEFKKDRVDLQNILKDLDIKEKYKDMDIYELKSMIFGTMSLYYSMQMSSFKFEGIRDLNKDSDEVLDFLAEFISEFILDAICETK